MGHIGCRGYGFDVLQRGWRHSGQKRMVRADICADGLDRVFFACDCEQSDEGRGMRDQRIVDIVLDGDDV